MLRRLFLLLFLAPALQAAEPFTAKVVGISKGDTLTVSRRHDRGHVGADAARDLEWRLRDYSRSGK